MIKLILWMNVFLGLKYEYFFNSCRERPFTVPQTWGHVYHTRVSRAPFVQSVKVDEQTDNLLIYPLDFHIVDTAISNEEKKTHFFVFQINIVKHNYKIIREKLFMIKMVHKKLNPLKKMKFCQKKLVYHKKMISIFWKKYIIVS